MMPYLTTLQRVWADINAALQSDEVRRVTTALADLTKAGARRLMAIRRQYVAKLGWPIATTLECLVVTGTIFALAPDLDLIASNRYYVGHAFIGPGVLGNFLRVIGWLVPSALLAISLMSGLTGLVLADWSRIVAKFPWLGRFAPKRPSGAFWNSFQTRYLPLFTFARTAFLALSMLLGPGLLVNGILKDHWHRPRPVQVTEFGGTAQFQPWWSRDGSCETNCSFVSGEASAATWLLAPALLVPAPFQPLAVAAAFMFAIAVGRLRMAFGGHFLSDTLISILLTTLVILLLHRWLIAAKPPPFAEPGTHSLP